MSIELLIYLAGISRGLNIFFILLGLAMLTIGGFALFYHCCEEIKVPKTLYAVVVGGFLSFFLGSLVPTERSIYLMAGAHVGKEVLQSETAGKVVDLLNAKLDEELAKLKDKK